ncbi:hypothetical protein N7537_004746 [Penicillium hordei]|uniref:LysM domain-containing protein n=1 Tax=Penicillium hordei TaxID=40994 RepID=A0AAD6H7G7_9EURO|nr:uncharacterized protein N7537_004746 [Penicillium hordei]KAJ5608127.1 hypothetical protein N7537_004746 [Penicillium hordei]
MDLKSFISTAKIWRTAPARKPPFSALDILADDDGKELSSDPVDWNSIMIYGSEAGGKEDGNGGREVVMTKKDGTTFGYNTVPSQKDIDAVHTIYQDSLPVLKKKSSTLFWKKASLSSSASSPKATTSHQGTSAISNSTITRISTSATPYSTLPYNTTTNPVTITDSTWPPSQTQTGQPSACNNWYQAKQSDTCKSIVFKYSTWMYQNDFTAAWYPPWTYSVPVATNTEFSASPVQSGIATACQDYYIADETDTCESIVDSEGFLTEDQFVEWNPAVGTDCSDIKFRYYYCIWNGTSNPMPSTTTAEPSPVQTGITSSCKAWYKASDGDDCDLIPEQFGTFSKSDFLEWNPAVKSDCSGLVDGDFYCVAVPDTSNCIGNCFANSNYSI